MNMSEIVDKIDVLQSKIGSYRALLSTNKCLYEGLNARIYELYTELSVGINSINYGGEVINEISEDYIKKQLIEGLKVKALDVLENTVLLEIMIKERNEEINKLTTMLSHINSS